jgi:hypothetical protein
VVGEDRHAKVDRLRPNIGCRSLEAVELGHRGVELTWSGLDDGRGPERLVLGHALVDPLRAALGLDADVRGDVVGAAGDLVSCGQDRR